MKFKQLAEKPKVFALVFDEGDEALAALRGFADQQRIDACEFTAIGALASAVLGYFNVDTKQYDRIAVNEQVELLSLVGNISAGPENRKVHAHAVVGKRDGTAHGGHLLEAHVRPTLEVILTELPATLRRKYDDRTGLALIDVP